MSIPSNTATGAVLRFERHDRLRKAREYAKLDAAELAAKIGVSDKTIYNYESEGWAAQRPTVIAWALATGVSFDWLWAGVDDGDDPDGEVAPLSTKCSASIYPLRPGRTRNLGAAKAA